LIAAFGVVILVLVSCGESPPGTGNPGDLTGEWSGTATFGSPQDLEAEFTLSGTDVGGTVRYYGGFPYWGYEAGCTFEGDTMTGYFYSDDIFITGNWEVTATLSSDGDTLSGTMEIIGNGSTGTFELTRQ
jgi:hypothetical protein